MKCRLVNRNEWWYGEVYGNWEILLFNLEWEGWRTVTENCYTKIGAKYELWKWIKKNNIKEFEMN